ncbi:hypothetical protein TcasGA2_TC016335 [Tribolium castaneum]|uniref:Uncharacterized protein n=1 Tax=Tribolium castaneum TaxID=7070 RepID=D7GYE9_TRICA|nr:hypothetical protein TcasGA2_TC016335 [Tribolium castaneum]
MLRVAGASPQLTNRKHTPRPIKHENVELDTWNSVFYGAREKEILLADLKFQIIEEKRGTDAWLTSKNYTNVSKI